MSSKGTHLKTKMDMLIEKINDIQDICTLNNISHSLDLPQIVVIGSQSSGKSSVLENIVGRDFLPRGTGIVTRRPLILQLIYSKNAVNEYAIFNHKIEEKFTDFNKVKDEIIAETNREIKAKNDVSHKPITLKLFSSRVLTLTLIDLPGLVKVPTSDQPKNICMKIEEICRKYIINQNAIILAVSAANIDISNSDALQLARSVDPGYDRTIGILTKIDLMDRGTDVINILSGHIIKLRFGFVPVVSRSQIDIEKNKCIKDALEDEKAFFSNCEAYKSKSMYCGTSYLISKLNFILHEHIKICLPQLQQKIGFLINQNQKELKNIGYVNLSPKETILKIINDISKKFNDLLNGNTEELSDEITGGARLTYTFNKYFAEYINNINPLEGIKDENIRTLLYNSSGSSSTVVFPQMAFEKLVKTSIKLLQPHSIKLVNIIFNELIKIIHQAANSTCLPRFAMLHEKALNALINLFRSHADDTTHLVTTFVEWNIDYLNTKHSDFQKYGEILAKECAKQENQHISSSEITCTMNKSKKINFDSVPSNLKIIGQFSKQELCEIATIKSFVAEYFEITRKIVIDQVPKAIMSQLVMKSNDKIQQTLFKEIYEAEGVENLVCESLESVEKRKRVEANITALKQAYDIMCSI
ncbi:hypothetical protein EDEG_00555 [Edhazardia aedis USNM 41457]|uniref:Dynamin-type G domain-containing protein n=1 Tax=Edhazardia aedis (strain USNM 41457) TaxID=1003232 RepID=J9DIN0_EDHAE|nr:hypothetical protein EDEG_00555 [Edhazardia aedis USNM 41457]|eukprot:EJW01222.1 hypothetical protein EDEG_00555 [Edhazardia aedis USNM 41457]